MTDSPAVRFSDFVHPENVLCALKARNRDEALTEMTQLLHRNVSGFDLNEAVAGVIERENVEPTLIETGLALPHTRMRGLAKPLVAVGLSAEGIPFAVDEAPARIMILVLTPQEDPSAYLRLVAAISRSLGEERNRRRLMACSTPDEVASALEHGTDELPAYLSARDLMNPKPTVLKENDTLAHAIHTFVARQVSDIPVLDDEGDVKGVISEEDVLRLSLPEHLLWMEDLSSIIHFEPFAEVLRKDEETQVADIMREEYPSIHPDAPAIELARIIARDDVRQVLVMEGRRLLGTVGQRSFIAQIFWA